MLLILVEIAILAVLSELDGVPSVGLLKTREATPSKTVLFSKKKPLERLGETISQHLDGGGRNVLALPFESLFQIILARECSILLILLFDRLKHLIVHDARLTQAVHKQTGLFLIHKKPILKRSHADMLIVSMCIVKYGFASTGGHSPTWLEASGQRATYEVE